MPDVIPLKCKCGSARGRVDDATALYRIICTCRGCQAYAHYLGREDDMLDQYGGTQIYPIAPAQMHLESGAENLRCVRLTSSGAMRWYLDCCQTPVGNTLPSGRIPWLGLPHQFIDRDRIDELGGPDFAPVRFRIHARSARAAVPGGHQTAPMSLVVGTLVSCIRNWLQGRDQPSPFFTANASPVLEPHKLNVEERGKMGLG